MPKVSVVVPVYKVEEYIGDCIESILNQTLTDFELILIDDGSPDRCGTICENYSKMDNRVKVIHQDNGGLSAARNTGIENASGEYITFIDSDDEVCENYLETLYDTSVKNKADIVVAPIVQFTDGDNSKRSDAAKLKCPESVITGRDACLEVYRVGGNIAINAVAKLYNSKLFSGIRFPVGRLHEDQATIPIVFYPASNIVLTYSTAYLYRQRSGSIMQDTFHLKRYDDLWAVQQCIEYFEMKNEKDIVDAAKKKKKILQYIYAIYAKASGVTVPEEYRVDIKAALKYLKKNVSDDKYQYYLSKVDPKAAVRFEYERKLKSIIGRRK